MTSECPSFNNNQASFCWQKPRSCFCVPKLRIFKYQHLWLNCCLRLPSRTHWYQHGHTYLQTSCHMQSRQIPEICGFKTTPKTSTKTKLQVTSYKLQTRTKKSKVSPLCFCCCLARNISEPPRNYAEDLFIIFFCCYVAFP